MTERETALHEAVSVGYGNDTEMLRRAEAFRKFLLDELTDRLTLTLSDARDQATQDTTGPIQLLRGEAQLAGTDEFDVTAAAFVGETPADVPLYATIDNPAVALIAEVTPNQTWTVYAVGAGSAALTVTDGVMLSRLVIDVSAEGGQSLASSMEFSE